MERKGVVERGSQLEASSDDGAGRSLARYRKAREDAMGRIDQGAKASLRCEKACSRNDAVVGGRTKARAARR